MSALSLIRRRDYISLFITFILFISVINNACAQYPEAPLKPQYSSEKSLYGYADSITGKLVIPFKYKLAKEFHKGLAIVIIKDYKYEIINIRGKSLFNEASNDIKLDRLNELFIVRETKTGFYGVLDYNLKQILPCEFEEITPMGNILMLRKAYTINDRFNGCFGFFNKKGECIVPLEIPHKPKESSPGYIGNPMQFQYSEDNIVERDGLISTNGEVIIPFTYRYVVPYPEEKVIVAGDQSRKYYLFDFSGKKISESAFDFINNPLNGYFPVEKEGKLGFYKDGLIVPIVYDKSYQLSYSDGTFILQKESKFGVTDLKGIEIVPYIYDKVTRYSKDLFLVTSKYKSGLINTSGKTIVPCEFEQIPAEPVKGGFLLEGLNKKFGAYNLNGENTVPFVVDEKLVTSDYTKANEYISKLLEMDPMHHYINYLVAVGYYNNMPPQEALSRVDALLTKYGTDDRNFPKQLLYIRSKTLADLNNFKDADFAAFRAYGTIWGSKAYIYLGNKKVMEQDLKSAEHFYDYASMAEIKAPGADSLHKMVIAELRRSGQWQTPGAAKSSAKPVASLPVTILNFTANDRLEAAGNYEFRLLYTYAEAVSGCPAGFRMPRLDDWVGLVKYIRADQPNMSHAYQMIYDIGIGWGTSGTVREGARSKTYTFISKNTYNLNISPLRNHSNTLGMSEFQKEWDVITYWFEPGYIDGKKVNTIEFMNDGFQYLYKESGKACVRYIKN